MSTTEDASLITTGDRPEPATTRDRLVTAGASLLDELPFERLLAGVPTAAIAATAGVTTGSFFHHFASGADFTEALVTRCSLEDPVAQRTEDFVEEAGDEDFIVLLRNSTVESWRHLTADPDAGRWFRLHLHLAAHHRAALPGDGGGTDAGDEVGSQAGSRTVGDLLALGYRRREVAALDLWETLLERAGVSPAEPFTTARASRALTALLDGLLLRHFVDPDAIDEELFSDICTLVTNAIVTPSALRRRTEQLVDLVVTAERSPQARSGARRRRASRERIAREAVGMFNDGWERVPASDVAERSQVVTQTVLNLFGTTRVVAALTFARHMPELRAAVEQAPDGAGPLEKLRPLLVRLAELAAADPEPARALLEERMVTTLHAGEELLDIDVRLEVPIAELFVSLTDLGLDQAAALDVASTLINFTLVHAIPRPGSAEQTADLALRLVPRPEELPEEARAEVR